MCADFDMSNNEKINLATPTNSNDTANKSHVDGVKQAATLGLYLYTFFNYELGHDNKNEAKFWKSGSKYAVSNNLHFTLYSEKLMVDVDGTYEFH